MAERDTIGKVKDKQGTLSQIQNFFTESFETYITRTSGTCDMCGKTFTWEH
ncbi:MAG: hypothetical protein ACXACF_11465 [Candidatus Hermodarchaeia archaeon]